MKELLLASGNQGKVNELQEMLAPLGFNVVPQKQYNVGDVPETGTTFVENAIIKARHAAEMTGLPCIADDSGLEVAALNGKPGIYSARFAGPGATDGTNIDKLLSKLDGVPMEQRQARFVTVLVFMRHANDPCPVICEGYWDGVITTERHGDNGFGYDPVFFQPDLNKTAAQLSPDEKHARSHRGQALRALLEKFKQLGI
ncbi:XTP/dITP diphosphatase [Psychrosphaera ytuae]|uniref:dITP/XTP pyrophosphatase n=1 Tax=Psychrosphaera ytuae TaxID=2820710 RepID=A0A975DCI6_9GAMM|nr:XTP/dITP diphosphatase [Psychrosphaera ytuae]QTH64642.1 XTP/dITP diphosphatase [Psychrosphaera ytuae]